jgi:Fe-S-cluster containining protein
MRSAVPASSLPFFSKNMPSFSLSDRSELLRETWIQKEGYPYAFDPTACAACGGACCTGESGYIWVRYDEMNAIADFLELDLEDFGRMYLRKVKHRYSLTETEISQGDFACIFFDVEQKRCMIYPVRPRQCRTYPFWEPYKSNDSEVREACPGIV